MAGGALPPLASMIAPLFQVALARAPAATRRWAHPAMDVSARVTVALRRLTDGDPTAAEELLPLLYGELRAVAERCLSDERRNHTLQPTALVHEAYLRLVPRGDTDWEGRNHFLRTAARAMRHVLVDHARARRREKRGGDAARVPLDAALETFERPAVDLVALDEALQRLTGVDEEMGRLVELRFFGGLTIEETARILGVSTPTVERRWRVARMWLREQLGEG